MKQTFMSPDLNVYTNSSIAIIQFEGEPQVFQRPSSKGKQFQNVSMMIFQQLIMTKAGAMLGSKGLQPFTNPISIEMILTTLQPFQNIELEYVIKSVLDGLNKSVIQDDSLVVRAQCWLERATKRSPKTRIDITVSDIATNDAITFQMDIPPIQKVIAVPYDIGGALQLDPKFEQTLIDIENGILKDCGTIMNQYEICHMCFCTVDMSKDIDNLYLMYIRALRKSKLLDGTNNIGIGMYKRHVNAGEGRTIINLVSK